MGTDLVLLMLLTFGGTARSDPGPLIDVCPSCEIRSVREAVAHSRAGGVVRVHSGVYREGNIVVGKAIAIEAAPGEPTPVIDGLGAGNVFFVQADGVSITGLAIRGSGESYTEEFAGIKAMGVKSCRFEVNELDADTYGIYLGEVSGCQLRENRIRGRATNATLGGNGIHLWHCDSVEIVGNSVEGHRDGIYFEFVSNSDVRKNVSARNLRYGLHFMYSSHDRYEENAFRDNGSGVAVMYSKDIRITQNIFEGSLSGASYGLLLKEISASEFRGNRFERNTVGAYLEGTTRSIFVGNVFRKNGWALRVLGDADGNSFVGNDFLENTFDLGTNATRNLNQYYGNYWSHYRGIDLDGDGVGDTPYYPVQLSALLMEKFGTTVLLTRSFLFQVLDEAESLFPVLVPDSFRDGSPRMRRVTVL